MWITYVQMAMGLISSLPGLIQSAEAAFSGKPGSGALKKFFVTDAASAALNAYQSISTHPLPAEHVTAILGAVNSLTDSTVAAMNTAGLLMGKPSPAAAS